MISRPRNPASINVSIPLRTYWFDVEVVPGCVEGTFVEFDIIGLVICQVFCLLLGHTSEIVTLSDREFPTIGFHSIKNY